MSPDLRQMMEDDPSGARRVDVILQARSADNASLRAFLNSGEARIIRRIGSGAMVVNLPLSMLNSLSASGLINYVSPDRKTGASGHIETTTGAAQMRTQPGDLFSGPWTLDGSGVGIAFLDSGIFAHHTAFKNNTGGSRVVANVNFSSSDSTEDRYGHGTHVAALAAGNESRRNGAYRGIAPNANIVNVKVLDDDGSGQISWLLAGLDWVKQNRSAYNIKVINLSLGSTAIDSYRNDPVCLKVKELVALGITVVAAAGNLGKSNTGSEIYGRIHSPGNSPYAITVGASNTFGTDTRSDDAIATFSSRGPTRSFYTSSTTGAKVYDNVIKPDLVAPGNKIVSSKSLSNLISLRNPTLAINDPTATIYNS